MSIETGQLFSMEEGSYRWSSSFKTSIWNESHIPCSPNFTFLGDEFTISLLPNLRNIILTLSKEDDSPPEPLRARFIIIINSHFEEHIIQMFHQFGQIPILNDDLNHPGVYPNYDLRNLTIYCDLKRLSEVEKPLVLEKKIPTKKLVKVKKYSNTHVKEEKIVSENKILRKLQKDFNDMFLCEEDCDCTLKVQNKEFTAHRIILRARSPVFKSMFSHDMVENRSGVVDIEDCDHKTFPDFLKYLYSGSTEHISEENVCHLYTASDKYQVEELKQECAQFMKSNLSIETFCDFLTLALRHSEAELIDFATKFFCYNAIKIAETAKWQIFLQENSTVGNELFLKVLLRGTKT